MVNIDIRDRLDQIAAKLSVERLVQIGEFLRFIESSLKNYVNRQMLTDALALVSNEETSRWLK